MLTFGILPNVSILDLEKHMVPIGESNFLVETRLLVVCTNDKLSLKMLTTAVCQHFGLGKNTWFA
ncbi:MAG: hypothetical protein EBU84_15635 [Actinobacteria bacterium]|nr:hypothetical protein [Actinomycetota bacterium]